MLKIISTTIILSTLFIGDAMACGSMPPSQSALDRAKVAETVNGKNLECNYNGETSEGRIQVFYPRCINGAPRVQLRAFGEHLQVTEISRKRKILTIESPSIDWPIVCKIL